MPLCLGFGYRDLEFPCLMETGRIEGIHFTLQRTVFLGRMYQRRHWNAERVRGWGTAALER